MRPGLLAGRGRVSGGWVGGLVASVGWGARWWEALEGGGWENGGWGWVGGLLLVVVVMAFGGEFRGRAEDTGGLLGH